MHRVESRAHLLTVGHLSAERGAELQEGAQEQRAADWRCGHGGLTTAEPGEKNNRNFPATRSEFQEGAAFALNR